MGVESGAVVNDGLYKIHLRGGNPWPRGPHREHHDYGRCGVYILWSQDGTYDPREVTCGNCQRTKAYRETDARL